MRVEHTSLAEPLAWMRTPFQHSLLRLICFAFCSTGVATRDESALSVCRETNTHSAALIPVEGQKNTQTSTGGTWTSAPNNIHCVQPVTFRVRTADAHVRRYKGYSVCPCILVGQGTNKWTITLNNRKPLPFCRPKWCFCARVVTEIQH